MASRHRLGDVDVASIVNERPRAALVFERRGIDFCCGGATSLGDACRRAGVDLQSVIAELDDTAEADEAPWATMPPAELVDHIEQVHHRRLHEVLPTLARLLRKVVDVHGAVRPELAAIERVFTALRADLDVHLAKEEQVLHPRIRELVRAPRGSELRVGTIQNPIVVMQHDHRRAGELLATLRRLTDGYVLHGDGCASLDALYRGLADLEADVHLHIHKENNLLYPAVVALEQRLPEA